MSPTAYQSSLAPPAGFAAVNEIFYLDHNAVVGIVGLPRWADADAERAQILDLRDRGVCFALSAWHAYELARSMDTDSVRQYCEFVEQLSPLWANNPASIKRQELQRFLLSSSSMQADDFAPVRPFSRNVGEMWGSYGAPVIIGETFRNTVRELKVAPGALRIVEQSAAATPRAISTVRLAQTDGRIAQSQPAIDREYFAGVLGCRMNDARLELVLPNLKDVYRACPLIAAEHYLSDVRARDSFVPTAGDAPDLQHAVVALAYGSAFITDDKGLSERCRIVLRKLSRPVRLHKRVCSIVLAEASA